MVESLISVIIPVYNTESYLRECLETVRCQTYSNLEILIVDDGSTDGSAQICREYCNQDPRFHLIQKKNQGLGEARNTGLDHAKGEYYCFVDSDDYLHPRYVEMLFHNLQEYNADISLCGWLPVYEGGHTEGRVLDDAEVWGRKEMIRALCTSGPGNKSEYAVLSCNKLIRAEVFRGLRFQSVFHEDEFIVTDYILRSQRFVCTHSELYYYRQRSESIMGQANSHNLAHLSALDAVKRRLRVFKGREYREVYPEIVKSYFENATIQYLLLKDRKNKWKLTAKVYPQFILELIRNAYMLDRGRLRRYVRFLISPDRYRKIYWK